jgi:hypothetical protein
MSRLDICDRRRNESIERGEFYRPTIVGQQDHRVSRTIPILSLYGPALARIGVLRALNQGGPEPAITPRRKRAKPAGRPMKTVWIYVDANREVGDVDHLKVFAHLTWPTNGSQNTIPKASPLNTM